MRERCKRSPTPRRQCRNNLQNRELRGTLSRQKIEMEVENSGNLLFQLPEEIVEMMLRHLDPDSRRETVLVCRAFYEHICRLEKGSCLLKINEKMLADNDIFDSMMSSKRRITEIGVELGFYYDSKADISRLIAIINSFKKHMKTLEIVGLPRCSKENYCKLLNAASDAEDLSINRSAGFKAAPRRFVPLSKFNKLKSLCLHRVPKMGEILDEIPDDSLDTFSLGGMTREVSAHDLQAFLNRQRKIDKLFAPLRWTIDVQHLALKKLTFWDTNNMISILAKQPLLQSLKTYKVADQEFSKICQMRNLEELDFCIDDVAENSIRALRNLSNLKELKLGSRLFSVRVAPQYIALSQTELPTLQKLTIDLWNSLDCEQLIAMGRNMPNLQHLNIGCIGADSLPAIIHEFVALKSLNTKSFAGQNEVRPVRQSETFEELAIRSHPDTFLKYSMECVYLSINSCPNLKRIELRGCIFPDDQLLEVIQRYPRLTHFGADVRRTFRVKNELEPDDSWLSEIIDIFRNSQSFIRLHLRKCSITNHQQLKDSLHNNFFKTTISRVHSWSSAYNLTIAKKSSIRDPHKDFLSHV